MKTSPLQRIAIVGAGVSGLTCARHLADTQRFDVVVFEKSRGVGGRTATKRVEDFKFDIGLLDIPVNLQSSAHLKVVDFEGHSLPVPTAHAYCKEISQNLNIQLQTTISKLEYTSGQWHLQNLEGAEIAPFDAIILTAPPAQTLNLLPETHPFRPHIAKVEMNPCFSLMITTKQKIKTEWSWKTSSASPLARITHQSQWPDRSSSVSVFVAQTSADWARAHLEDPLEQIQETLVSRFSNDTGIPTSYFSICKLHRWRYATTQKPLNTPFLYDTEKNLGVCGDWLVGDNFWAAWASGSLLGQRIWSD